MKADNRFANQDKAFWAHVRSISQHCGYTKNRELLPQEYRQTKKGPKALKRKTRKIPSKIKVPSLEEMCEAMTDLQLGHDHLRTPGGKPTKLGRLLDEYFQHRANVINGHIQAHLMNSEEAKTLYEDTVALFPSNRPPPMNKQKGEKKAIAYLTATINLLIEANAEGMDCDYDPRELTSVTHERRPVRTLARRVDGAFPQAINPIAIWEIKEYYYTTSFGSRVADGVYETLLDGLELEELRAAEGRDIKHCLMIDGKRTWWKDGKSYLCRIVDMLHMRYVDEVLVGREIMTEMPRLVAEWRSLLKRLPPTDELKKTGG